MKNTTVADIARVIKQSKRLRLKENYYYVKVSSLQINLIDDTELLRNEERMLVASPSGVEILRFGITNICAIWSTPADDKKEVMAVYKSQPITADFIIAEVYDLNAALENNLGEISLFKAFNVLDGLKLPNADNMIVTVGAY